MPDTAPLPPRTQRVASSITARLGWDSELRPLEVSRPASAHGPAELKFHTPISYILTVTSGIAILSKVEGISTSTLATIAVADLFGEGDAGDALTSQFFERAPAGLAEHSVDILAAITG